MIRDLALNELSNIRPDIEVMDHAKSPDHLKNVVVEGDVCAALRYVKDESIHLTFTSPAYYNARDYSKYSNYNEYLDFLEHVFV